MPPCRRLRHDLLQTIYWTRPCQTTDSALPSAAGRVTFLTRIFASAVSREGAPSITILSPIFEVNRVTPPSDNCVTPPHSQPQRVGFPSLPTTSMLINE